jgi:hypothetical protein
VQENGAKTSLLKVVIRRQRYLNVAAPHNDKRQAIGQAPVLVGAIGEQAQRARAQLQAAGNHLNPGIQTNHLVRVGGHAARSRA